MNIFNNSWLIVSRKRELKLISKSRLTDEMSVSNLFHYNPCQVGARVLHTNQTLLHGVKYVNKPFYFVSAVCFQYLSLSRVSLSRLDLKVGIFQENLTLQSQVVSGVLWLMPNIPSPLRILNGIVGYNNILNKETPPNDQQPSFVSMQESVYRCSTQGSAIV